eukprot:TRINITY_DN7259_c0_g1_i2.p1 TRINITY_DN7259_c0_g1~~TRINITY_DN7259_c0_g1_i2.p1  ORF type:complete len:105 (+),score=6.71 TRINITY_DN7259_c0_g1_i2:28-342(+)
MVSMKLKFFPTKNSCLYFVKNKILIITFIIRIFFLFGRPFPFYRSFLLWLLLLTILIFVVIFLFFFSFGRLALWRFHVVLVLDLLFQEFFVFFCKIIESFEITA